MDVLPGLLGAIGSALCVALYFLLERGSLKATDTLYYALNGLGAALVLIACTADFDKGDWGAAAQEACWVLISILGLCRNLRRP